SRTRARPAGQAKTGRSTTQNGVAMQSVGQDDLQTTMRGGPFKRLTEKLIIGLLGVADMVSLLMTVSIVGVLVFETIPFFREVSFSEFFLAGEWQPLLRPVGFGIWELIAGTLNVVLWSMLIALPIGLASAIYLSEYAHPRTRSVLKPLL